MDVSLSASPSPLPSADDSDIVVELLPYHADLARWYACIRDLPHPMLLSSGQSTHPAARFDILTADPGLVLRSRSGRTTLHHRDSSEVEVSTEPPFALLARHCPLQPRPADPDLPFTGGVIAWFSYELLHGSCRLPLRSVATLQLPDMFAGLFDWSLVIDNRLYRASLVLRCQDPTRRDFLRRHLQQALQAPLPSIAPFSLQSGGFQPHFTREQYLDRFRRIIDYIEAGDCYQVNLAQCFSAACQGDSWDAFARLQQQANAPFAALLCDGDQHVLSFSPERFIKVEQGVVTTQPIKGTRPRSSDVREDERNRLDLESSVKDRAENLMIVDLLRNDLGRVCDFGSVRVDKLFELQSFANVHHLVSTISGRLREPADLFKLLPACFPGGSITGAPKLRAMQIIDELETMPRSVYCGVIAWIDQGGDMDSNIAIRTLVRDGNHVYCWGGGGIVADSVGAEEYQETFDKIGLFLRKI